MKRTNLETVELREVVIADSFDDREAGGYANSDSKQEIPEYVPEKYHKNDQQDQRNQDGEANQEGDLDFFAILVPALSMGQAAPGRPDQGVQVQVGIQGLEDEQCSTDSPVPTFSFRGFAGSMKN